MKFASRSRRFSRKFSLAPSRFVRLAAHAIATSIAAVLFVVSLTANAVRAQCPNWDVSGSPTDIGVPGMTGPLAVVEVLASLDLDGPGGKAPQLYASGLFAFAGFTPATNVAVWDDTNSTWVALGSELTDLVVALEVFDDDGSGPNPPVLYAGGNFSFTDANGNLTQYIARWDGTKWLALGPSGSPAPVLNAPVRGLRVYNDGGGDRLYVSGHFTFAGATSLNHIARWSGSAWSPLAVGASNGFNNSARGMIVSGGSLVVGGDFTIANPSTTANYIAQWNGSTWTALGTGMNSNVWQLALYDDKNGGGKALYAGGFFTTAGGSAANRVAKWDGSTWTSLGNGAANGVDDGIYALKSLSECVVCGKPGLFVGGRFTNAGGSPANHIAKWDGTAWSTLASGTNDFVFTLENFDDGGGPDLYVGGPFTTAGGATSTHIAEWDGCIDTCSTARPRFLDNVAGWTSLETVAVMTNQGASSSDPVVRIANLSSAGQASQTPNVNWVQPLFDTPSTSPTWTNAELGSVFGVALDDQGNIYVAHTSIYKDLATCDTLGSVAAFSPGAIYKIDTGTGAASWLTSLPNFVDPGCTGTYPASECYPGIGDLAFDCNHQVLFASNFEDGIIYGLDPNTGGVLTNFDPGPPDFPDGWAPLGDRPWALAVHHNRLYYSMWNEDGGRPDPSASNEIWSVSIDDFGNLGVTGTLEITLAPYQSNWSNPVAGIAFSPCGRMLLAERCMSDDTTTEAHQARVLEYVFNGTTWVLTNNTMLVGGFGPSATGGIDYEYSVDPDDRRWAMGDALHYATGDFLYGLQGSPAIGAGDINNSLVLDEDQDVSVQDKWQLGDLKLASNAVFCPSDVAQPRQPGYPFCSPGDGVVTTPCGGTPAAGTGGCTNANGAPGNGCPNSFSSLAGATSFGAHLTATGSTNSAICPTVGACTVSLVATGMSGVNTMCLFLRGNTNVPTGVFFGDGVRCCATLARIGLKFVTGTVGVANGTATAGFAATPSANISALGGNPQCSGQTACYQVWYRNTAAWCSTQTSNVTNAYSITW